LNFSKKGIKMARRCELTGTGVLTGNNVSHAHNKTRRRFLPNLQKKRIWIPEEGRWITLKITAKAIRTLDKKGYLAMVKELSA
jgi:large subunit ribosomal protein L28